MEIQQEKASSTSSSSGDSVTDLTRDLYHKLSIHRSPSEDPSNEVPRPEDHVEENQSRLHDVGKGNEAGEQEEDREGRGGELEDEDVNSEDDFSFCCEPPDGSPVSAEDIFADGRIRPVFPLFNQSLLRREMEPICPLQPAVRRLFAEDEGDCPRVMEEIEMPSPGSCKKSNSTGSSKLCRFVDLTALRSTSDGKDAFVFLRKDKVDTVLKAKRDKGMVAKDKVGGKDKGKGKGVKPMPAAAAKGKATEKHRSYLPYRRDLLGFFTNSNLLSKNVHPF